MLQCYGLVGIPRSTEIKEISGKTFTYLKFDVVVQDRNRDKVFHKYPVSLVVPPEEVERMKKDILENSVFYLENGQWSMEERDPNKSPWPSLSVWWKSFKKLSKDIV
jgi:hypothetical protein